MAYISDLPMLHDIDADYTPQYVKLARVLRDKIESGKYDRGDTLPAADLAREYNVSIRVTYAALATLAANRYVDRPGAFTSYSVIRPAATRCGDGAVRVDGIPAEQSAVVGANIRALRLRNGWTGMLADGPGCYTSTPKSSHSPSSSWLLSPSGPAARRIAAAASSCPALISRSASAAATASSKVYSRSMVASLWTITEWPV